MITYTTTYKLGIDDYVGFLLFFANPMFYFVKDGDVLCGFIGLVFGSWWAFSCGTVDSIESEIEGYTLRMTDV